MSTRRQFLRHSGLLLLGGALPSGLTQAAPALPDSGRLLFGYPPGAIGTQLGQGIVEILARQGGPDYRLENIDARNTRQASEMVSHAPGDGRVLLHAQSTSMCLLPNVYRHLGYDPLGDFTPLGLMGELTFSLTVGPLVPRTVTNLAEYLDWLSDNPDLGDVGFSIYGSQGHLSTLILGRDRDVLLRPRPYKGSAIVIADLKNKALAAGFTAAGNGNAALWQDGTLRSIGITSVRRLPYWPQVSTLAEQGVGDMDIGAWYGWFAPSSTPEALCEALRQHIGRVQASDAYRALHQRLLLTQLTLDAEQIRQRIREERQRYASLVASYNLSPLD